MKKIEGLEKLGSTNLVDWMRENMLREEKYFKDIFSEESEIFHIRTGDLNGFKAQVEQFAKDHPDAEIKATGFMISYNPDKKEEYRFKRK